MIFCILRFCLLFERSKYHCSFIKPVALPSFKNCSDDQLWDEDMKAEDLTLEGGEEEEEENSGLRKARFLVYWMTTTRCLSLI